MENLAMNELERGREYVNQLRRLIIKSKNGEDDEALTMSYAQDLAAKVEDSLRNAIFLLNNQDSPPNSDESVERYDCRSHTIKNPTAFSPQKRKSTIQTWEDYSKIGPKEDGYAWRKYGEKFVLNAKHPRCYFRCTFKYDKGCEATKQVQVIQDHPPLYRTTYFGYHSCSKSHMFLDSHNHSSFTTTRLISFDNNNNNKTTLGQNINKTTFLTQMSSFPHPARNVEGYCKHSKQQNIKDYAPSSLSNGCLMSLGEVLPFEYDDLIWM